MLSAIGLHQPKTPENVGAVMRAAYIYSASMIAIKGRRYTRAGTDTTAAYRHLPVLNVENLLDVIPYDCVPVAVELVDTAQSLYDYVHPKSAFYIFGPEDGSVPSEIVSKCRDVIYIPGKTCMNLAATVNVVLYDRAMKLSKQNGKRP